MKIKNITFCIAACILAINPQLIGLPSDTTEFDESFFVYDYEVVKEKTAKLPEYDFKEVSEQGYTLKDTAIKQEPSRSSRTIMVLDRYEEIKITGINNLDYWRIHLNGNNYYIEKSDVTISPSRLENQKEKDEKAITLLEQTESLPPQTRFVEDIEILKWAEETQIISSFDNLDSNVSARDYIVYLWKLNKSPRPDVLQTDDEYALAYLWIKDKADNLPRGTSITIEDALKLFSEINNEEDFEEYSKSLGLIVSEDELELSDNLTNTQCLRILYYSHYNRKYNGFPITIDEFLESCKNTMDHARINGYRYGNSTAQNPTTDGFISCDRLIAKALYDLGYTDQPTGGITCGSADNWLSSHGFIRSTSWEDVKRGSIMLVKHQGKDHTSHMFVFASDFNMNSMTGDRYDAGSDGFIQSVQPLKGLGFWYRTDDIIVYNIPE